jgi:hypothetical protein
MGCPKFVDNTRECIAAVEFVPPDTLDFCTTEKYRNCPFYLIITGKKEVCVNIKKCPAFKKFSLYEADKFIDMCNKFCTSKNHVSCQRFIRKMKGEEVPVTLHPDGHLISEWTA